jgi:cyclophilin family peptidyl-prolyl cis-trans isomerase
MNKLILPIAILMAGASILRADDVALLTFKYGGKTHQAAIELYDADAPLTVANFKKLARKGFYNGLTVHRAFPHTLIQTGDPLSGHKDRSLVGTGGPGYTIPAEIHLKHVLGAVAAARLPDKINPTRLSNGSQFYICLKPMPSYDGQYTVFGRVLSGMDTLDEISAKAVDTNDNPIDRIVVQSIKIVPREKLPQISGTLPAGKPASVRPISAPAPVTPASARGKHALTQSVPVTPAPATPAPVKPKPWWQIWPSSGAPAPTKPAPVTPAPSKSAAVTPPPAKHAATTPKPAPAKQPSGKPAPATPAPATPAPKTKPWWQVWPSGGAPAPAKSAAVTPAPAKPAPATPAPAKPATPKPTPARQPSGKAKPATPAPATPTPKPKPWWQIF